MDVSEAFIKQLNLFEFESLPMLSEKIVQFSETGFFLELVKSVPFPKEEKKVFQLSAADRAQPTYKSSQGSTPMRKMYTQRTNLVGGGGAASSSYDETYYNENDGASSMYSKLR